MDVQNVHYLLTVHAGGVMVMWGDVQNVHNLLTVHAVWGEGDGEVG